MEKTGEQRPHKSRSKRGESGSESTREREGSSSGSGAIRKSRRRSGERSRSRNRRRSGSSGSQKSPTDDGGSVAKHLPGNSTSVEPKQNGSSSDKEMRRMSKLDDPLEKNAIREKLRAKPGVRREGGDTPRMKGPMVARPLSSPSPVEGSSSASSTPPPPPVSSSSTRRPRSLLPQRSQSPSSHSKESPFTKQVVNRVASPTSPRLPRHRGYVSPSGSRPGSPTSGHRRAPSPNNDCLFTLAVGVLKKRVERALHARLFLLTQNGPNSFLIGGDSPDHKYKVTIGSQNCNCGKGPFCVHLLFVMLRVFKVAEDDNLLWNRTLKNYEVELLFAKYEAMKKKKLKQSPSQSSQRSRRSSQSPSTSHLPRPSSPCPSTGSSDQREDEDLCPICLLDMVEGESLVECKNGCHNKLHHHCVAVWEGECQRQQETMVCPLCRAVWADCTREDQEAGAPSTAHSSAEQGPVEEEAGVLESSRLQTYQQKKERWKEAFDDSLVEGMFSRDWGIRENTLHSLSQQLSSKLKDDRDSRGNEPHDVEMCEQCFQGDVITMESGFDMVAMACSDPVYKVYVAALRVLRTLLMCSHCSTEEQQAQLRLWLQPVMSAILVKSADGNRRTAQLSVSAMFELARGDSGELAVSKELSCSNCIGLGSLDYILSCLISDIQITVSESSKHILGCLCVLERVFSDFPERFVITDNGSEVEKDSKIECLVSIATCVSSYLNSSHSRMCKIAKKISVIVAKILVADASGFARICDMMRTLESREVGSRMMRRLQKILDEYEGAQDAAREREDAAVHGDDEGGMVDDERDRRQNGMRSQNVPCATENTDGSSRRDENARTPSRPSLQDNARDCFQNRTPSSEPSTVSDLSDISASPTTPCDNPISFKSEVASSPKKRMAAFSFPLPGVGSKNCKDEVEAEEAEALAIAMEASMHTQGALPCVPGLRTEKAGDVIIKIDHKNSSEETDGVVSPRSKQYMESVNWTKGAILGTGAFSSCYMARDVKTGTLMAVKQISFCRNNAEDQEETMEEIIKEIKLMATFDHPHIVRLMGATQHDGHFNVFVEWMPGGAVSTLLRDFGAFSNAVTVKYIHQVCLGLAYLHDNKVIHRDLKGANLLMDSTGHHLRIADLGTAAKMNADITRTDEFKGQFLGTISFMAPEVLRGEPYGRSCDIWSVGCCIIEMCTTKPPWNDAAISNHYQLLFKIASANGPPPIPESLSPALRDIALRCLEAAPKARPGIMELLKHAAFTQINR
ncbi:mitogen-activated protein kinase kinase kinase 1-like isoform X1 [Lytechinus variegatus]|uniref:mitogen-activated protein kinase kinase kinase 1-like isoform X1 n=2 Tax=Lytechinus variegatus TaxID=7654 RepID=UPI001BB1FBD8|nr:mitogen-activated protein kinase kinase kinase 1-like isoform X1 [Lytechinus variegatus]